MKVQKGMKCRYKDAFGFDISDGVVLSVEDDGQFTVYEPLHCPPQYNDTVMEFRQEDIGQRVFFDTSL